MAKKPNAAAAAAVWDPPPGAAPQVARVAAAPPPARLKQDKKRTSPWLKPYHFPKGRSPNPGGRPKDPAAKKLLTTNLQNLLTRRIEESEDLPPYLRPFVGMTFADLLVAGLVADSATGNGTAAFREAANRVEGLATAPDGSDAARAANVTVNLVFTAGKLQSQVLPAAPQDSTDTDTEP